MMNKPKDYVKEYPVEWEQLEFNRQAEYLKYYSIMFLVLTLIFVALVIAIHCN